MTFLNPCRKMCFIASSAWLMRYCCHLSPSCLVIVAWPRKRGPWSNSCHTKQGMYAVCYYNHFSFNAHYTHTGICCMVGGKTPPMIIILSWSMSRRRYSVEDATSWSRSCETDWMFWFFKHTRFFWVFSRTYTHIHKLSDDLLKITSSLQEDRSANSATVIQESYLTMWVQLHVL